MTICVCVCNNVYFCCYNLSMSKEQLQPFELLLDNISSFVKKEKKERKENTM